MYFWRIEKMKTEMVTCQMSEREVLPYVVVSAAVFSVAGYIRQPLNNRWDALSVGWSLLLAVFGTIYIYRQNGGANGQHFLQRYLALGWVVGIRWFVAFTPVVLVLYVMLAGASADAQSTRWQDVLIFAVAEIILYWRIGYHVRDLAMRTMPDQLRVGGSSDSTIT